VNEVKKFVPAKKKSQTALALAEVTKIADTGPSEEERLFESELKRIIEAFPIWNLDNSDSNKFEGTVMLKIK